MPAASVYTCRVTNWAMLVLSIPIMGLWTYISVSDSGFNNFLSTALWFVVLMTAVMQSTQRISAGPAGLSVNFGPFGFPRVTLARADIAHAEIIDLPGGPWSLTGVTWRPKRGWLLALNTGPALRLRSINGRRVTVSMRDPAAALWAMGIAS
ncbi:hypothetical protein ACQP1O_28625 [Nocardia sp. CA-151230]|uniref:hypothetical protein n=1 Tax=Nocardia sp. CA-151230 TaxID=3239982 RepID=UPI003D8C5409